MIENAGTAPETLEELLTPTDGGKPYLDYTSVPKDPWKMPYMYDPPSVTGNGKFRIYTFGKDKSPGGEGENADVSNLTILGEEE